MLGQQTIAAYQGGGVRRSGVGAFGFSAFADVDKSADGNPQEFVVVKTNEETDGLLVTGAALQTAADLHNLIVNSSGTVMSNGSDAATKIAKAHSWQFSITQVSPGVYKIENIDWSTYALYGGGALLGVVLLAGIFRK